jgi:hypothetical protein
MQKKLLAKQLARLALTGGLALVLPGCKPPPTDAGMARVPLGPAAGGPSAPLPSPDTSGALWASTANPLRLVYGVPGQPVLVALECLAPASPEARLRITRHAPADDGAGALLALIGRGAIGRFPVDATDIGGRMLWQGEAAALAPGWDAFKTAAEATVTVAGAGLVRLNPSRLPFQLVETCRGEQQPQQKAPLSSPVQSADPA